MPRSIEQALGFYEGVGYHLVSGLIPCLLGASALGSWLHKHNCHEHRCWRLGWHADGEGRVKCRVHHPDHPSLGWLRSDKSHPRHPRSKEMGVS